MKIETVIIIILVVLLIAAIVCSVRIYSNASRGRAEYQAEVKRIEDSKRIIRENSERIQFELNKSIEIIGKASARIIELESGNSELIRINKQLTDRYKEFEQGNRRINQIIDEITGIIDKSL